MSVETEDDLNALNKNYFSYGLLEKIDDEVVH